MVPRTTPSDVVAALMYFVDRPYILADPHRLHRALLVAQTTCPLLNEFGFSAGGVNPISRGFDEALGILKLSRIVRMENTDYERYYIDNDAKQYVKSEILPRFSEDERASLTSAAAIIRAACAPSAVVPVPA
jgi:hypothetical protein